MDFLDRLCAVKSILLPSDEEKNKEKGDKFEEYVESLFDKRYFVTEEWTSDIYNKRNGSYVESTKIRIWLSDIIQPENGLPWNVNIGPILPILKGLMVLVCNGRIQSRSTGITSFSKKDRCQYLLS